MGKYFIGAILLVFTAAAYAQQCVTAPPNIVYVGAKNACEAGDNIRRAFEEARKRMWFASYVQAPLLGAFRPEFPDPLLANMGPLRIEERSGKSWYWEGREVNGLFWPMAQPRIEFAGNSTFDPLAHETTHWLFWTYQDRWGNAWRNVQHGTLDDPYVQALNRAIKLFYDPLPPNSENFPGYLPNPRKIVRLKDETTENVVE